jgi:hypothetical protein
MRSAALALALLGGCLQSPPSGSDGSPTVDAAPVCPTGADKCVPGVNGHLYAVFSDHVVWDDASLRCLELGAYLATDRDEAESDTIARLSSSPMWIGLSDTALEGSWVWVSGESFAYSHWRSGEPSHDPGENCVLANWSQEGWNDIDCAGDWAYVCEIEESAR